ncbi:Uncharacterised protein [uncultured archaeon]|nr:Uncharacterised protein [uncultured archaeon]
MVFFPLAEVAGISFSLAEATAIGLGTYALLGASSIGYTFLRTGWPDIRQIGQEYKSGWSLLLGLGTGAVIIALSAGAATVLQADFYESLPLALATFSSIVPILGIVMLTFRRKLSVAKKVRIAVPKRAVTASIAAKMAMSMIPESAYTREKIMPMPQAESWHPGGSAAQLPYGTPVAGQLGSQKESLQGKTANEPGYARQLANEKYRAPEKSFLKVMEKSAESKAQKEAAKKEPTKEDIEKAIEQRIAESSRIAKQKIDIEKSIQSMKKARETGKTSVQAQKPLFPFWKGKEKAAAQKSQGIPTEGTISGPPVKTVVAKEMPFAPADAKPAAPSARPSLFKFVFDQKENAIPARKQPQEAKQEPRKAAEQAVQARNEIVTTGTKKPLPGHASPEWQAHGKAIDMNSLLIETQGVSQRQRGTEARQLATAAMNEKPGIMQDSWLFGLQGKSKADGHNPVAAEPASSVEGNVDEEKLEEIRKKLSDIELEKKSGKYSEPRNARSTDWRHAQAGTLTAEQKGAEKRGIEGIMEKLEMTKAGKEATISTAKERQAEVSSSVNFIKEELRHRLGLSPGKSAGTEAAVIAGQREAMPKSARLLRELMREG